MMKMRAILFLLLAAGMGMSACTKDEPAAQDGGDFTADATVRGELRGSLSPIGSAKEIEIYRVGQRDAISAVTPDKDSHFVFTALEDDTYMLRIIPNPGYAAPKDTLINFNADKGLSLSVRKIFRLADLGKVSGQIGTAAAVSLVTIFQAPGTYSGFPLSLSVAPDPSTGDFMFSDVPVGTYTLNFQTRTGFIAQENRTIEVKSSAAVDVGTVTFEADKLISRTAFKAAGNSFNWTAYASIRSSPLYTYAASYTGSSLNITAASVTGNIQIGRYGRDRRLAIKLDHVDGPGTYSCQGTATSDMTYSDSAVSPMQGYVYKYGASIAGSNAVVIITAIDPVAKIIRGSFSGKLKASNPSGDISTLEITEGSFEIPYE